MSHTPLTPYSAYLLVQNWSRANGRSYPTSQAFYGYARSGAIKSFKTETKPNVWFDGDSFAVWFEAYRNNALTRQKVNVEQLLAEYLDTE